MESEQRSRTAELTERLTAMRVKAEARAETLPGASVAREALEHERDLGGGLIAGGVAFRAFLWLVPFGLVAAALLSFWSTNDEQGLEQAARSFGLGAAAAEAAAEALQPGTQAALFALGFGLFFLAWFTLGLVRALILAYSLAWELKPPRIRRPLHAIAVFNGLVLAEIAAGLAVVWLREELGAAALLGTLAGFAFSTGIALAIMWLLPHRATRPRELLPGALLVAGGDLALRVAVIFYFAPRLGRSEETYGAFGAAATILLWLYVLSRLLTGGAFLNAVLWRGRRAAERAAA